MTDSQLVDVMIIGAGLTGLTAAYYLQKNGLSVAILEKNDRIGGVINTIYEDGFACETGPNTGVLSHPEAAELFEELAGHCKLEIADPSAKRRLIWKSGQWHALPDGPVKAIRTPLFTAKDKLRILGEPFRRKGTDPFETVEHLVLRRLGKSYLDYAVDPFIGGIYAGDPSYLVTRYALPKLYALEQNYGSFIGGAIKKNLESGDPRMKKATREVFSAENGLGSLIKALGKATDKSPCYLNAEKVNVKVQEGRYIINASSGGKMLRFNANYLISTIDAQFLPDLLPFLTERELSPITGLKYAGVVQVVIGFRKWQGMELKAFGGLVPSGEKRDILGVLFTSSFLKNRAPENGALLSVFIGGTRRPELTGLSDNDLKELAAVEVKKMLRADNTVPDLLHLFRYPRAIPQYGKSSKERLEAIESIQKRYPGLVLAGAIRDGIGMSDRIRQANIIAGECLITSPDQALPPRSSCSCPREGQKQC